MEHTNMIKTHLTCSDELFQIGLENHIWSITEILERHNLLLKRLYGAIS